jgi:hypothetical protein
MLCWSWSLTFHSFVQHIVNWTPWKFQSVTNLSGRIFWTVLKCIPHHHLKFLAYLVNVLSQHCLFLGTIDTTDEWTYQLEHPFFVFLLCGLFNDAVSSSVVVLNEGWWMDNVLERHLPGGTEENHKRTSVKIAGRYLNPGPPEYKATMLTTQLHCLVCTS